MAHCADDHRAATEILLSNFNYVQQQQNQHNQQQQITGMKPAGRSRRGKKRQNKQPQRGLGVAQLEKIRLEEQRRAAQQIAALHHFNAAANLNLSHPINNSNSIAASVGGLGVGIAANAAANTSIPPPPSPIFYLNHQNFQLHSAASAAATPKSSVQFFSRGFRGSGVDLLPPPVPLSNSVERMWDGGRARHGSDDGGFGLQNFGSEPPDGCSTSSFIPQILSQRNQNQILNTNHSSSNNSKCLFPSSIDRMAELSSFQNVCNNNNLNTNNKRPREVATGTGGGGVEGCGAGYGSTKSHASCNVADICELSLGLPGCTSVWDPPDTGGADGAGPAPPRHRAHSPPLPPEKPHAFLSLAVPSATWWRSAVPPGSPSPVSATTTRSSATGSDPSAEEFVSTPMSSHTNPQADTRRSEPPLVTTILSFSGSLDLSLKL